MDPGELCQDGECIMEGTSDGHLLSQGSPDMNEIFGDPQILCRVGDQYQVGIPPLLTESEHLQLTTNTTDTKVTLDQTLVGLPIPIIWVCQQVSNVKHELLEFDGVLESRLNTNAVVESERSKTVPITFNNGDSKLKAEFVDLASDNRKRSGQSENGEPETVMDSPLCCQEEPRLDKMSNKGFSPLPGSRGSSWSNMEVESFLLGLYIFGKNLVLVKSFVGTKEMGDILSYYYGKFYRSDGYRKWSECRKIRSRKCIHGQRIFTGWRQQELLSRLFSCVSNECHTTLLEVSKSFGEGKTSLEDYVSSLKAAVGMSVLIEAIGIGKGKHDITSMVDPIKTTRPEIPIGKECNSLSAGDIIKFLTGDFRLSKNKSHDLFWEAVWPRLLATGWHSEEPKDHNYAPSKNSLVFLVPGVKKFSRRRLVKGIHYFDSVTDVLNKVASDPSLLVLEGESPKIGGNNENGWDRFDSRRQSYLQPKTPKFEAHVEKFTVVDTSLERGEGPFKIRELRTLPSDTIISPPTSLSRGTDTEISEEQDNEPESTDMLSNGLGDSNVPRIPVEDQENRSASTSSDKHPKKSLKRKHKSNYLTPITKRRMLNACEHEETCRRATVVSLMVQKKTPNGSSAKDISSDSSEAILSEGNVVTALSPSQVERRPLIDLNLPHDLQDLEPSEPITTEVADDIHTLETSSHTVNTEQEPIGRRQSTRNRPLTTKALEALACGYLNNPKRKKGERDFFEDLISRPSRRARGRGRPKGKTNGVSYGISDYKVDEGLDEECSSNTNWSEREDSHELLEAVSRAILPEHSASKDD